MKKLLLNTAATVLIIGFSIWLYASDEAAKPGALSSSHDFIDDCETCHTPWQGVKDDMCRQCHFFDNPAAMKPRIRFHESGKNCLECHFEHRGYSADISEVDHTLFHTNLSCTDCHFDQHDGKFGDDCRACHDIDTWEVSGFRHPPAEDRNCHRCHGTPASHREPDFWDEIQESHEIVTDRSQSPPAEDCWRCHTTHRWGHMRMDHDL